MTTRNPHELANATAELPEAREHCKVCGRQNGVYVSGSPGHDNQLCFRWLTFVPAGSGLSLPSFLEIAQRDCEHAKDKMADHTAETTLAEEAERIARAHYFVDDAPAVLPPAVPTATEALEAAIIAAARSYSDNRAKALLADPVEAEVALVLAVLRHPAGFDLDFAGGLLCIRPTEQGTLEVEWEEPEGTEHRRSFDVLGAADQMEAAARFFVETRHELKYGFDYEKKEAT